MLKPHNVEKPDGKLVGNLPIILPAGEVRPAYVIKIAVQEGGAGGTLRIHAARQLREISDN